MKEEINKLALDLIDTYVSFCKEHPEHSGEDMNHLFQVLGSFYIKCAMGTLVCAVTETEERQDAAIEILSDLHKNAMSYVLKLNEQYFGKSPADVFSKQELH